MQYFRMDMLKRNIREALAYALHTSIKDMTFKRLVVQEFYVSLNRKGVLTNDETEEETAKAIRILECLADPNCVYITTSN